MREARWATAGHRVGCRSCKDIIPLSHIITTGHSLRLLTGGAKDLPARQQTLRNTIEWSYQLLTEGEKQLFQRSAVFVGGSTLEAMEAVCGVHGDVEMDVLDGIASLVDKSLVRQEEAGGEPRYLKIEKILEYAAGKFAGSTDVREIEQRHSRFFLQMAEEAEPHLTGSDQIAWLARLDVEHDNLRAALETSLTHARSVDQAS